MTEATEEKPRFTLKDKIINPLAPYAIPALAFLGPAFAPGYEFFDSKSTEEENKPSNSYKPVVVFSSRTVEDVSMYETAFATYATEAQSEGSGIRACFSFVDKDKENTVLQFAWYDSPADYTPQPKSLTSMYKGTTESDYCAIFGGWDDALKTSISAMGECQYSFADSPKGYLKEAIADHAKDFNTGSKPMIWISKRKIKAGAMEKTANSFQKGVDSMYYNAPAALGIMEFEIPDEEDHVWSLRVFNDFDLGFKRHFPVPSLIMFRMIFNVVPNWEAFPIGLSFSAAADIEGAIEANPGNKAYVQYHMEKNLIGPEPDFGKGF
jgi:hypothetical protein